MKLSGYQQKCMCQTAKSSTCTDTFKIREGLKVGGYSFFHLSKRWGWWKGRGIQFECKQAKLQCTASEGDIVGDCFENERFSRPSIFYCCSYMFYYSVICKSPFSSIGVGWATLPMIQIWSNSKLLNVIKTPIDRVRAITRIRPLVTAHRHTP